MRLRYPQILHTRPRLLPQLHALHASDFAFGQGGHVRVVQQGCDLARGGKRCKIRKYRPVCVKVIVKKLA
jgi:hypothetical protein